MPPEAVRFRRCVCEQGLCCEAIPVCPSCCWLGREGVHGGSVGWTVGRHSWSLLSSFVHVDHVVLPLHVKTRVNYYSSITLVTHNVQRLYRTPDANHNARNANVYLSSTQMDQRVSPGGTAVGAPPGLPSPTTLLFSHKSRAESAARRGCAATASSHSATAAASYGRSPPSQLCHYESR